MTLKEELKKLAELQKIDGEIYALRRKQQEEFPAHMKALALEFETKKKSLQALEAEYKECIVKKKSKETDLAGKEANIQKAHAAMYALKTNKEYAAKLSEIASMKADCSILEEDILKLMDAAESTEKARAREKAQVDIEEKKFKEQEKQVSAELQLVEARMSALESEKRALTSAVDAKLFAEYEKLLVNRGGIAMARIREGSCGACHMNITAQTLNEVKMYSALVPCPSCTRILYLPEDDTGG